jgi:plastocyanin
VHALAVQLAPILAAEKSKTPFYIAGGVLVAWALIVSLGLGLRRPDFPGNLTGQRIVGAISAVLVLAALSTAVITSGGGTSSAGAQSAAATPSTAAAPAPQTTPTTESPPAATTTTATSPKATTKSTAATTKSTPAKKTATSPKATTGTPAPPSKPAAATTMLQLAANPAGQLAYETKQLTAKAGTVTVQLTNKSPIEHDVAIAQGTTVLGQTPVFTGGSKSVTVKLKPGTYKFFCTVPGHRQAGMEGTLTVS